jgi:hypothetical protein
MVYSAAEKKACAERELKMRERVYPRWVAGGKMTASKADTEIAIMREIVADYAKLAERERLL